MAGNNSKLYSIILFGLLGVSGILSLLFFFDVVSEGLLINWCYLLLILAAAVSIVFPIMTMAKDFGKAKNSLIGIGALLVIFGLAFVLSSDEVYKVGEDIVEGAVSKRSEAGLITFYILIILAVASIVYSEVSKAFK